MASRTGSNPTAGNDNNLPCVASLVQGRSASTTEHPPSSSDRSSAENPEITPASPHQPTQVAREVFPRQPPEFPATPTFCATIMFANEVQQNLVETIQQYELLDLPPAELLTILSEDFYPIFLFNQETIKNPFLFR